MRQAFNIVPECFIDTILTETLLELDSCNHQKGIGKVLNVLVSGKLKDGFAIGIIDDDKQKSKEFEKYEEIGISPHFSVMKHKEISNHFLILIKPAQEEFIIRCATAANLNLEDYGLSFELETLKEKTKDVLAKNNIEFKRLFKRLQATGEMYKMKSILQYLCLHPYDTSVKEIREILDK